MKVEDKPLTMPPAEKTEEVWQPENDFRTSILRVFQPPRPAARGRQEIARFPATPALPLRLTQRALSLKQRASDHSARLNQCASEIALDCASGRSSLRAATATDRDDQRI